jgi:predicted nucleic acid-binding protein
MTSFVDTNVVISLLDETHVHHIWCAEQIAEARVVGPIVITDIVYSEFSVGMGSKAHTDEAIKLLAFERHRPSADALYLAGRAFKKYKEENDGPKLNVLPDFIIGAHAYSEDCSLITCNNADFRTYFEHLLIKAPTPSPLA